MSDTNSAAQATPQTAPQAAPEATSTEGTNAQAAVAQAVKAPQLPPPASSKKKYQIKVDGRQEDLEFDPSNEEEVKKHLQMSRVAQKRMQQFTEYEGNVKTLFELLKSDPIKVLSDPRLGITEETRKHMAEMIINNEIQELQKTPEQREKEKLQRDYENLKKQHEEEKKSREQQEFSRMQQQYAVQFDNEISDAIDKSGLPKTSTTVKRFADALMFATQNGISLSARELAPLIKKQVLSDYREMTSSLPDDEFEEWLGKDNSNRLRKRSIQRLKQVAQGPAAVRDTGAANKPAPVVEKSKVTAKDFFRGLGGNQVAKK